MLLSEALVAHVKKKSARAKVHQQTILSCQGQSHDLLDSWQGVCQVRRDPHRLQGLETEARKNLEALQTRVTSISDHVVRLSFGDDVFSFVRFAVVWLPKAADPKKDAYLSMSRAELCWLFSGLCRRDIRISRPSAGSRRQEA